MSKSVIQPWVTDLTLMQQSVLLSAIRGPDGMRKDHVAKKLSRWLRRCILVTAFDGIVYEVPYDPYDATPPWRSGSFTGPSCYQCKVWDGDNPDMPYVAAPKHFSHLPNASFQMQSQPPSHVFDSWQGAMTEVLRQYMKSLDETPHHYQLHFMHAAEIIGYKHHDPVIALWWHEAYAALANDMHLNIETATQMDFRLGDREEQWRKMEKGVHADD